MLSLPPDHLSVNSFFSPEEEPNFLELPLFSTKVEAGFPSPAEGQVEEMIDLNKHLVKHPAATFFVRVSGDSMIGAGIQNGDLLVIDRSLEARNGDVVLAVLNSEFTVKRLKQDGKKVFLLPENPKYRPIEVKEEMSFEVWGVVASVIHQFRK